MEILEFITVDRIIAFLILAVGVLVTKLYGSNYIPRGKGRAIEKYMVTDIFPFRVKGGSYNIAQIQLVKSSIKNACGFAGVHAEKNQIVFHHYGFANNCIHAIIAPGHVLFDESKTKHTTHSNEFTSIDVAYNPESFPNLMIPKKYRKQSIESMLLTIHYSTPKTYTGPMYKSKKILFVKGIGIINSVTTYSDGTCDEFILKKHKVVQTNDDWWPVHSVGNFWVYNIRFSHGPNKVNIKHGCDY